jgi:hypothetical protein
MRNSELAVKDVAIDSIQEDVLRVFPNPSRGTFNVRTSSGEPYILTVVDALGRTVISQQVSGNEVFEISERGIYFVTLKRGEEILTTKVVVE